jgi:hypothetical protein
MNLPQARLLISGPSRRRALNQSASLTVACKIGSAWTPAATDAMAGMQTGPRSLLQSRASYCGPPEASGCRTARSLQQHSLKSEVERSDSTQVLADRAAGSCAGGDQR